MYRLIFRVVELQVDFFFLSISTKILLETNFNSITQKESMQMLLKCGI